MSQLSFLSPEEKPPGLFYFPDFITPEEELILLTEFQNMNLRPMQFRNYVAKRNVLSFGSGYEFSRRKLQDASPAPEFLDPFIRRVSKTMKVAPGKIAQILVTHYPVGAPIGWHRDAPPFEQLLGISLGSSCTMKLREMSGNGKFSFYLESRSAYMMTGPSRWRWEHHIPPVKEERYSLTFRTLVEENLVDDRNL